MTAFDESMHWAGGAYMYGVEIAGYVTHEEALRLIEAGCQSIVPQASDPPVRRLFRLGASIWVAELEDSDD